MQKRINCQTHNKPVIKVRKSTGQFLCQECVYSQYYNINHEKIRADAGYSKLLHKHNQMKSSLNVLRDADFLDKVSKELESQTNSLVKVKVNQINEQLKKSVEERKDLESIQQRRKEYISRLKQQVVQTLQLRLKNILENKIGPTVQS